MAMRCCSPPGRRAGASRARLARPTRSSAARPCASASARLRPRTRSCARPMLREHGEMREQVGGAEHHADGPAQVRQVPRRRRVAGLDRHARHADAAAGRRLELVDAAQQRALARTPGPEQRHDLAGPHRQVDVVEDHERAEPLADGVEPQDRLARQDGDAGGPHLGIEVHRTGGSLEASRPRGEAAAKPASAQAPRRSAAPGACARCPAVTSHGGADLPGHEFGVAVAERLGLGGLARRDRQDAVRRSRGPCPAIETPSSTSPQSMSMSSVMRRAMSELVASLIEGVGLQP